MAFSDMWPTSHAFLCESLATKFHELADVMGYYRIDVMLILEMMFAQKEPAPQIPGFDDVRRDRDGSSTRQYRGGGLMVCVSQGIQHSIPLLRKH